jgi:lambda repressor-like predicted transcriptional regulator
MARKKKRKVSKPADRETRERIVTLRDAGMSWGKLSAEMDMPPSTLKGIYKRETGPAVSVVEDDVGVVPLEARVLKPYPNPRLVCIYFGDRKEGRFAKCVVRPRVSWIPHQKVMVLPVEGDDELYRLERDFIGA